MILTCRRLGNEGMKRLYQKSVYILLLVVPLRPANYSSKSVVLLLRPGSAIRSIISTYGAGHYSMSRADDWHYRDYVLPSGARNADGWCWWAEERTEKMDTLLPGHHKYPFFGQFKWVRSMSSGRQRRGEFWAFILWWMGQCWRDVGIQNQMQDAMTIWDSICHSQWFKQTSIVSLSLSLVRTINPNPLSFQDFIPKQKWFIWTKNPNVRHQELFPCKLSFPSSPLWEDTDTAWYHNYVGFWRRATWY